MPRPPAGYSNKQGERIPGCSTIASIIDDPGGLIYWANQQGLEGKTLQEARQAVIDPGTLIHDCIESYLLKAHQPSIPTEFMEPVARGFGAFVEWYEDNGMRPMETEQQRISETYQYAGTPDFVGFDGKGRLYVVDWKSGTGSRVYPSQLVQARGYGHLVEECDGIKVERYGIHKFDRESGNFHPHIYTAESLEPAWEAFVNCRVLYDLRKVLRRIA